MSGLEQAAFALYGAGVAVFGVNLVRPSWRFAVVGAVICVLGSLIAAGVHAGAGNWGRVTFHVALTGLAAVLAWGNWPTTGERAR